MLKKKFDWKELGIDLLVDLAAGMLVRLEFIILR